MINDHRLRARREGKSGLTRFAQKIKRAQNAYRPAPQPTFGNHRCTAAGGFQPLNELKRRDTKKKEPQRTPFNNIQLPLA